eukprot:9478566-Pyramimonas_sp.AAC.1
MRSAGPPVRSLHGLVGQPRGDVVGGALSCPTAAPISAEAIAAPPHYPPLPPPPPPPPRLPSFSSSPLFFSSTFVRILRLLIAILAPVESSHASSARAAVQTSRQQRRGARWTSMRTRSRRAASRWSTARGAEKAGGATLSDCSRSVRCA